MDPVLQQAITEKGEELQVLTRLSELYTAQESILNQTSSIPDVITLKNLISMKKEEIALYDLLCGPSCVHSDKTPEKTATRGDAVHNVILEFLGLSGERKEQAQKAAEEFILSLPRQISMTGVPLSKTLNHIGEELDSVDKPIVKELAYTMSFTPQLVNLIKKTVYNEDTSKKEHIEKTLTGLAEVVSIAKNPKSVENDLSSEGLITDLLTNAHMFSQNAAAL